MTVWTEHPKQPVFPMWKRSSRRAFLKVRYLRYENECVKVWLFFSILYSPVENFWNEIIADALFKNRLISIFQDKFSISKMWILYPLRVLTIFSLECFSRLNYCCSPTLLLCFIHVHIESGYLFPHVPFKQHYDYNFHFSRVDGTYEYSSEVYLLHFLICPGPLLVQSSFVLWKVFVELV